MTLELIQQLRQALLDNAAGHPLAQVHRNNLFALLDECEGMITPVSLSLGSELTALTNDSGL